MRSAYFWRIRSASALRFSKGCSSLNLDRMFGSQRSWFLRWGFDVRMSDEGLDVSMEGQKRWRVQIISEVCPWSVLDVE